MATTYNRRINLYINGKEVKNDIASIRKEMGKLTNEQSRMTIGSQEYNAHASKIKNLRGIIQQHNQQLRGAEQSWFSLKRAAEGFNRYFGMVTAAMASFAGVALTIKGAVNAYAEFDDKIADVMKTTGLTKEEVEGLNEELKKIDTRTAQLELLGLARVAGKLGITDPEEILGFVRAADQIVVALAEDLGGAEDAVRELGKLTDIFKLKDLYGQEQALLKVGSAINELGMASTANEGYLVEFSKRTAGIAPQAGVSIENILGLAATLDALGQKAEMSSTAYSKLMTTMTKKTGEFARIAGIEVGEFSRLLQEDANEAMIRVFEGLNKNTGGFEQLVAALGDLGIEGQRMTSVFGALSNNTELLREQQRLANKAFEEGISLTDEFNIKNNTVQANLEKAKKRFAEMQRELGERLSPAYASVIKKSSTLIKLLGITVEFLFKHGKEIIVVVSAITAYTVATKLAVMWQNRQNAATLLNIASQKLQALATNAQFAAIALYNSAVALMTGRLKVAAVQFRAFSAAMMANPIGLVVGLITAAGTALYMYSKRLTAAEKAQKALNDVNLEAKKNIVEEKLEVERLLKVAKDDFRLKEDRIKAIERLKEISPKYLGNLSLESINTDKATKSTLEYIKALEQKAKVQAAQEKLVEIEKELLEIKEEDLSFWDKARAGGLAYASGLNVIYSNERNLRKEEEFRAKKTKELILQREKLLGIASQHIELDKKSLANATVDINAEFSDIGLSDFSKLIEADLETQRAAINAYFDKAGEGAFEAFLAAIEKRIQGKKIDVTAAVKFRKEEEEEKNPTVDYALEQYQQTAEFQLALNQSLYDKKLIGEQEYQDRLTEITRKAEEERYQIKEEKIEQAMKLTDFAVNFVFSMMELELAKAGENEEKKKQIKKKYANMQFLVTSSQIIVDTASAIMKALAELGPVAGPIAAGIIGATGALQLGVANAERKKVQELATGKYDVTGESGRNYKAKWTDRLRTGRYGDKPHLAIFNEIPGKPEIVIDGETAQRIRVNFPELERAIYQVRDGRIPQFAGGKYAESSGTSRQSGTGRMDGQVNVDRFEQAIDKLMSWEPQVELVMTDVAKRLARLEKINEQSKLN